MDSLPLLLRMFLALGIVLGLIFGSVWLARRVGPLRRMVGGRGAGFPLEVVGQTHLAPRRSVYAVRAAGRTLLLGVTPTQVSLLTEVPDDAGPVTAPAGAFLAVDARAPVPAAAAAAPAPPADWDASPAAASAGASPATGGGFGRELADVLGSLSRSRARLTGEEG